MEKGYVVVALTDENGDVTEHVGIHLQYELEEGEFMFRRNKMWIVVEDDRKVLREFIEDAIKAHYDTYEIEEVVYAQDSPNAAHWAEAKKEEAERVERLGY